MPKDPFNSIKSYSKVLGAYNRLLEQSFEERLFSEKDKKLLQKIYQRLEELSVLVDQLKADT